MEALKLKGVAHEGRLTVEVPEEFNEHELEVMIRLKETKEQLQVERKKEHEEKIDQLKSIVGTAQFPDFPISKYDVYEQ